MRQRLSDPQFVFVTGEAGVGKTTVVDTSIEAARGRRVQCIGRGQCIERYGAGEAYMPVLGALGQWCREPDGRVFVDVLARRAPTWMVQLPWLLSDPAHEVLQRRVQGATRERMLREMTDATAVSTAHGFPRHAAPGSILGGWAMVMQGQGEEGIVQIRQGMAAYRRLGMAMEDAYFLTLLAEAHASVGLIEEARATLAEAWLALPSERDYFYKAEMCRLQGELLGQRSASDEGQVAACFQQALEITRRQQAKSLELRAATSLSQLWQRQGKPDAARQLLAGDLWLVHRGLRHAGSPGGQEAVGGAGIVPVPHAFSCQCLPQSGRCWRRRRRPRHGSGWRLRALQHQ